MQSVVKPGLAEGGGPSGKALRRADVRDIVGDAGEAILVHDGEEYRLRITRNGKLILTK